jgi:mono/diheme cytochrome c family protein
MRIVTVWVAGVFVLACGGAQPAAEPPASPTPAPLPSASAAAPDGAAPASSSWDAMSRDEKMNHMKTVIFPKMKDEFSTFDGKRFSTFTCATCHGAGAKNGSFKMPNPDLPKIPGTPEGFKKLMETKGDITKFMMGKVKPRMASLLGETEFDPQSNPKGFGCAECHTVEK